ncbi:hypothetical protein niasHS_003573 [Heterodera schachtii]|uniref:SSD domain-containing protein n=1 Tax=Heterodera schachtii TaxID=97005 RepID=A0ABD2KGX4_HETSC
MLLPFTRLLFSHPFLAISFSLLFSFVLPIIILLLFPLKLGSSPEKGFETDGTPYAGPRLGWTLLQPSLFRGSRVSVISAEQKERWKRKSWTDELFSSVGSVACYDGPIPSMSFLSQFILTVPSLEHLFSGDILHNICQFQNDLSNELAVFQQFTPHRNIWSFPNYMACLTPSNRVNCSFINAQDVFEFRQVLPPPFSFIFHCFFFSLFNRCLFHRRAIVSCRRHCQKHIHWTYSEGNPNGHECPGQLRPGCGAVPAECGGQMWFDLFYRILPDDLSASPLPINAFLPFYSFAAYRLQGFDVPLKFFTDFETKLKLISDGSEGLQLKGLSLEIKRDILLEAAVRDSRFSLLAVLAVFILLCFYSLSLAFALAVLFQMIASVLCSLAFYRFFSAELPLLNLIALVLLISVGADGAFLLLDLFPATEKLCLGTLHCCLRHTAKTMFLTQFSTIVPFLLNMFSSVFAFRSFGLFAGLTLFFNYLLLVLFMPSFLVIQNRHLNPWLIRWWPSRLWYCFPSSVSQSSLGPPLQNDPSASSFSPPVRFPSRVPSSLLDRSHHFLRILIDNVLTSVLVQGRFVWLCSLGVVLIVSAYLCVNDLSLPRYNPLQLFRSSSVHEYFDQNAERLFPFVSDKIASIPLAVRLVWGIRPISAKFYFDANSLPTQLESDNHFHLRTVGQLRALAQQLEQMRALPFVEHSARFWPERFLDWSVRLSCASRPSAESVCCNVQSPHFVAAQLDSCIRHSTSVLFTNYNDTLIWDNSTHRLIGYTALLPTHLRYSHRFANLSAAFALFDQWLSVGTQQLSFLPGWYTTEWTAMSQWFDLQRAIISDCKKSICISFAVVFVFSSLILRWKAFCATFTIFCIVLTTIGALVFMGWEIGVLEGVIIVLAVGLSFDYTLHFGALVASDGCAQHRVQRAVRGAVRPVGMAALSSILAGGVMLFSETHAFFQVSMFLVICSFISFVFALFFFLPLLYTFLPSFYQKSGVPSRSAEPAEKGSAIGRCRQCFQIHCDGYSN